MRSRVALFLIVLLGAVGLLIGGRSSADNQGKPAAPAAANLTEADRMISAHAQRMVDEGRRIFRYETFGSEAFWGDALELHKAIAGDKHGGLGGGVSPKTALAVGMKVDVDALPAALQSQLKAGKVDLDDPATTIALLELDAVVGVKGVFQGSGNLKSLGLRCAFC